MRISFLASRLSQQFPVRAWLGGCVLACSVPASHAVSPPTELPPLLPVPNLTPAPCDSPQLQPRGPEIEYDRSLLYLPDSAPVAPHAPRSRAEERRQNRHNRHTDDLLTANPINWFTPALFLGNSSDGAAPSGMAGDGPLSFPFRAGLTLDAGHGFGANRDWAIRGGMVYLSEGTGSRGGYGVTGGLSTLALAEWSSRFISADAGVRHRLTAAEQPWSVAVDLGYQFAYLGEDLSLATTRTLMQATVRNQFHGGEIGLASEWRHGAWFADVAGRVGLGAVIPEATSTRVNPAPLDTRFGVMPTVNASIARQFTDSSWGFVGYTFQYLSDVARPGAVLNGSTTSDYWVQGVRLGWRWEY